MSFTLVFRLVFCYLPTIIHRGHSLVDIEHFIQRCISVDSSSNPFFSYFSILFLFSIHYIALGLACASQYI